MDISGGSVHRRTGDRPHRAWVWLALLVVAAGFVSCVEDSATDDGVSQTTTTTAAEPPPEEPPPEPAPPEEQEAAAGQPEGQPPPPEDTQEPSEASPPPDAPVLDAVVEGRVVDTDDAPLGGVPVVVTSRQSAAQTFGEFLGFVLSAGLICFAGDCFEAEESFQTTTGADGRYAVTLPAAHVPGHELDTDWFVSVSQPAPPHPTPASTSEEFEVAAAVQTSPDLVVWTPAFEVSAEPERVTTTWPQLDPARFDGRRVGYSLRFIDEREAVVWDVPDAATGDVLDARVLEDVAGTVELSARGDATVGPTIYHQTLVAPQVGFAGPAGAPPSRGATCALVDATGAAPPPGPCWLTDGALTAPRPGPPACPPPPPPDDPFADLPDLHPPEECQPGLREATVDLGAETEVDLIVVRRCTSCTISASVDGTTYGEVGGASGTALLRPDQPTMRFLRVVPRSPDDFVDAAELSAWAAPEGESAGDDGRQPDAAGRLPSPDDGGGGMSLGVLALAVALALIVTATIATVAFRLGRRGDGEVASGQPGSGA